VRGEREEGRVMKILFGGHMGGEDVAESVHAAVPRGNVEARADRWEDVFHGIRHGL